MDSTQIKTTNGYHKVSVGEHIRSGKSKDIHSLLNKNAEIIPNRLVFINADRFTVFDTRPHMLNATVHHKGELEAVMTACAFSHLHKRGIASHFLGLWHQDRVITNPNSFVPTKHLLIEECILPEVTTKHGEYDAFTDFQKQLKDGKLVVIPLECISRQQIIGGVSSITSSEKAWQEYTDDHPSLGLPEHPPTIGEKLILPEPAIDFTTKYEPQDTHKTYTEAVKYTGLDIESLRFFIARATKEIAKYFTLFGIIVVDMKIEVAAYIDKDSTIRYKVVDVVGPDEMRIFYNDADDISIDISKQNQRRWLQKSKWYTVFSKLKTSGIPNWKDYYEELDIRSPKINPELLQGLSNIYKHLLKILINHESQKSTNELRTELQSLVSQMKHIEARLASTESIISTDITDTEAQKLLDSIHQRASAG